jgi:hypothetical protein
MTGHWTEETLAASHKWSEGATIHKLAELLEVDAERVRLWMFARAAAEPRDTWDDETTSLARLLEAGISG